jgi:hypothetical protein
MGLVLQSIALREVLPGLCPPAVPRVPHAFKNLGRGVF